MTAPPRAILSLILIVGMMTIVRFGEQMIVKAMSILCEESHWESQNRHDEQRDQATNALR